jgi:Transcriptional regulators
MNDIQKIREFNRFYARFLGLFDKYALETEYSMTEARVIGEIGRNEGCTANSIAKYLDIDRSYMSRIMDKFERFELIQKKNSEVDSRKQTLWFTSKGRDVFLTLEKKSDEQVKIIIEAMNKQELNEIQKAMRQIKDLLEKKSVANGMMWNR